MLDGCERGTAQIGHSPSWICITIVWHRHHDCGRISRVKPHENRTFSIESMRSSEELACESKVRRCEARWLRWNDKLLIRSFDIHGDDARQNLIRTNTNQNTKLLKFFDAIITGKSSAQTHASALQMAMASCCVFLCPQSGSVVSLSLSLTATPANFAKTFAAIRKSFFFVLRRNSFTLDSISHLSEEYWTNNKREKNGVR